MQEKARSDTEVLDKLQPGAIMVPLTRELTTVEGYYAAHIVDALSRFAQRGGEILDSDSGEDFTMACYMTEKPVHLSSYPYTNRTAIRPKTLIVVDKKGGHDMKKLADLPSVDASHGNTFIFPELGKVLSRKGLDNKLAINYNLAALIHSNLDRPAYELFEPRFDWHIVRRLKQATAAKKVAQLLQATTPNRTIASSGADLPNKTKPLALDVAIEACDTDVERAKVWHIASERQRARYIKLLAKDPERKETAELLKIVSRDINRNQRGSKDIYRVFLIGKILSGNSKVIKSNTSNK